MLPLLEASLLLFHRPLPSEKVPKKAKEGATTPPGFFAGGVVMVLPIEKIQINFGNGFYRNSSRFKEI